MSPWPGPPVVGATCRPRPRASSAAAANSRSCGRSSRRLAWSPSWVRAASGRPASRSGPGPTSHEASRTARGWSSWPTSGTRDLVDTAVLAALDLRDQAATQPRALVLSHLRDRKLLLLVDNCEHLLEAAALLVADVLEAAPGVRVVATSREPLSIAGEHVIPIPPLELPRGQGDETLDQLRLNESVELFTQRAAAASGRFELTTSNRTAVVDVCRRLDGLPLAIELAAVRTRVLSVEQIDDRLADRFGLLTGGSRAALPRHQTLRTAIEWSHDLLGSDERTILRRLCVFAGRFTLEDVESVCASDDVPAARALDVLSSLVDKSLVMREDPRGPRLLSTARDDARLRRSRAAGGGRGGGRRAAMRRALRFEVPAIRRVGATRPRRVARVDGPGDRQHPVGAQAMPGPCGHLTRDGSRRLHPRVLGDACDQRGRAVAGRAPRDRRRGSGAAGTGLVPARVPGRTAGRSDRCAAGPRTRGGGGSRGGPPPPAGGVAVHGLDRGEHGR